MIPRPISRAAITTSRSDEVSRAFERAYAAVVRRQRAQLQAGEIPDSSQALRLAVRQELEALMRAH